MQCMLELEEGRIGHIGFFEAELFDRVLADDLVDARNVARTGMGHADGECRKVVFSSLDIAAVGKIVRALFCDHGNALGHTILRRVKPIILCLLYTSSAAAARNAIAGEPGFTTRL